MAYQIQLPHDDGHTITYTLHGPAAFPATNTPPKSRRALAAVHIVSHADAQPDQPVLAQIDWDATLAYREYLWSLGLEVAEAMDTAQRGMGLDWTAARELIRRSTSAAKASNCLPRIACGAGTDHLNLAEPITLDAVIAAYEEQCSYIEGEGAQIILMASRALAASARSPEDYARVYDRLLAQVSRPVILHWLGDMFDPALSGYWGSRNLDEAMQVCLDIIARHADKIDGIKLSLLDAQKEITMRRLLSAPVRMYTGDDFNYAELIRGDEQGYSHALLGIFDAIAPAAAAALQAFDNDDLARYEAILAPTVPLSRHIFQAPTYYYKTGVVFLAYLNGHQSHFRMVGGLETARSLSHLARLFVLADQAGLLRDPELAVARMQHTLASTEPVREA
ncbi:MAG: dihydrodipicolinate synthase family protein [Ktedonobacteraceae bacterium]|nr:dihydrodipicolinate synthase family protein [Ktedonobacteraceae bacterium]